jgi:hypothetical protein
MTSSQALDSSCGSSGSGRPASVARIAPAPRTGTAGLVGAHALVRVLESELQQPRTRRIGRLGERSRDVGHQVRQQAQANQRTERGDCAARQQQLHRFIEQARGRHAVEHVGEPVQRRFGVGMQREAELPGKPRRAQHAYRVLAIAGLRIPDQPQYASLGVRHAAHVVPDRVVLDVVVQRVGREIAAPDVFLDRAEVVAQDAAARRTR